MRVGFPGVLSSVLILASLGVAQDGAPEGAFEVLPKDADRATLHEQILEPRFVMPWPDQDPRCLAMRLREAMELRFEVPAGEAAAVDVPGTDAMRSFGDLVAACRQLRDRPRALRMLLERLRTERPEAWAAFGELAAPLVQDRGVFGKRWDPDSDTDGFLFGESFTLGKGPFADFVEVDGSDTVLQAACLIDADLVAIETAENDYTVYFDHVGSSYEQVYPVPGSYLRGADEQGPFVGLKLFFENDLPWPFGSYECDLRVRKVVDERGHLVTHTWSPSRDFYWIGGTNVYLPLRDADGEFVSMITVRLFGFDLRGIPEGDSQRKGGLRSVLGNLKRGAEQLFRERDPARELLLEGAIPDVPVRGRR